MPISHLSTLKKSNPYIAPVDIGLMTKILSLKDQQFKQNATQIQSELDQAGSLDLAKQEDKEYLNGKLNSLTTSLNALGGVDLGDASVANQLHGMTSSMYGDNDLLTAISSTQSIRKLQSQYDKMMSDPKLSKGFAPQNYQHDMQFVNAYTNNGKRTVAGEGYSGPTNPTPFFNVDAYAVEAAKRVKAKYTKSTTKEGIYLINGTTKEVTADQIKAEIQAALYENPQAMQQASINSAYLRPNITGQDLYTQRVESLTKNRDAYKKVYDEYSKNYATLPTEEQVKRIDEKKAFEANYLNYETALKETVTKGVTPFNENINGYRTDDYINKMASHLSNSFSFTEQTNEVKPDLASAAFLKNQLDAAQKGLKIVPDPASPSGFGVIANPNAVSTSTSTSSSNSKTSKGEQSLDPLQAGVPVPNVAKGEAPEVITDKVATTKILELNSAKQQTLQKIIADAIKINPDLAGTLGSTQAQIGLINIAKGFNDPSSFEIEDLRDVRNNPNLTPAQVKHLDNLWNAYETIQKGGTPDRTLTPGELSSLRQLSDVNTEVQLLQEMRARSMGYDFEKLTPEEKNALNIANSKPEEKEKVKPTLIASRWPDDRLTDKDVPNSGWLTTGIATTLAGKITSGISSGLYGIEKVFTEGREGTSLAVIEKDGKYIPADGKEHTYSTNYTTFKSSNKKLREADNKSITIPATGIEKQKLIDYVQPYDKSVISAKGDLTEVLLLDTPEKIAAFTGQQKLQEKKLIVKDPKAYDALNTLNMANNLAYTPDMDIQDTPSFLKAKALLVETTKSEQSNVVNHEGKKLTGFNPTVEEIKSAYISRIGNSKANPLEMDIEMTFQHEQYSGTKKIMVPYTVTKSVTAEELKNTLGITLPTKTEYLDKIAIDMNGRSKPIVFTPTISNPNLIVPMEIVQDPANPQNYFPQIQIPNGSGGYIRKNLTRLSAPMPSYVRAAFQDELDKISKYKTVEIGGKLMTISNTQDLYNAYLEDTKQSNN